MRWHGVDPASVHLLGGLSAEEMLARFRNGDADYLQVPNPFAVSLIREGIGHLAATLADESALCLLQQLCGHGIVSGAEPRHGAAVRQRLRPGPAVGCGERCRRRCRMHRRRIPDYSHDVLAESVRRYQAAGVWAAGPQIGRQGYDRMRDALIAGGLARGYHPYESIVRPQFAERAAAELA